LTDQYINKNILFLK